MAADVPQEEAPDAVLEEAEPDVRSPADCLAAQQVDDSPAAPVQADYSAASRAAGSELLPDDSPGAEQPGDWRAAPVLVPAD